MQSNSSLNQMSGEPFWEEDEEEEEEEKIE